MTGRLCAACNATWIHPAGAPDACPACDTPQAPDPVRAAAWLPIEEPARPWRAGTVAAVVGASLIVLLLVGWGGSALVASVAERQGTTETGPCPGHWHATFGIWADGERVVFEQPHYAMVPEGGTLPFRLHMHTPDPETLHFEPPTPACTSLRDMFLLLDVRLAPDSITLEGPAHSVEGTYTKEDGLRAWIRTPDGEWNELAWTRFVDRGQIADRASVLIVAGPTTPQAIAEHQDDVRLPPQ